jgi:tellurite resistance protein TerC
MSINQIIYLVFGIVLIIALVLDLGLLNKQAQKITLKKAIQQTMLWVGISLGFWLFLWYEKNSLVATKYISAYLMEWSLSIDNIFVFIIIFNFFKIPEVSVGRSLLIGILLAIVLRILFIAVGLEIIDRFHWVLYLFGAFLLYTGIKLFMQKEDEHFEPQESFVYRMLAKTFNVGNNPQYQHQFTYRENGKLFFTTVFIVVLMLAFTDIVFALDSIPTVVSLVRESASQPFTADDKLIIYSSNIFAVLGLRSLYFLIQGASNKFKYLQQGIAIVLVFIGIKMLIEYFDIKIPIIASLMVIIACIAGSIWFSINKKESPVE